MSVDLSTTFCGIELSTPVVNGSGTFDAIAAQRAFGEGVLEHFPFSAFVSKTITPQPRAGNPPPRLWETPAGMINSIGLPNKGLAGFLEKDLPELAKLPGIGPSKAQAIVEFREKEPFATSEDLRKVKGIGDKLYESIKDQVTVGDAPSLKGRGS